VQRLGPPHWPFIRRERPLACFTTSSPALGLPRPDSSRYRADLNGLEFSISARRMCPSRAPMRHWQSGPLDRADKVAAIAA